MHIDPSCLSNTQYTRTNFIKGYARKYPPMTVHQLKN